METFVNVFMLSVAAVVAVALAWLALAAWPARSVAEEWIARLSEGDIVAALDLSTAEFRTAVSVGDLERLRRSIVPTPPVGLTVSHRSVGFLPPRVVGLRMGVERAPEGGRRVGRHIEVVLREEDGGWRVKAVSFGAEIGRRAASPVLIDINTDIDGLIEPPLRDPMSRP